MALHCTGEGSASVSKDSLRYGYINRTKGWWGEDDPMGKKKKKKKSDVRFNRDIKWPFCFWGKEPFWSQTRFGFSFCGGKTHVGERFLSFFSSFLKGRQNLWLTLFKSGPSSQFIKHQKGKGKWTLHSKKLIWKGDFWFKSTAYEK